MTSKGKNDISIGRIVGHQKIISEIILVDDGYHRLELECINCGHHKTMAIYDLFRKRRNTGGCTKCGVGMIKRKNYIGLRIGDLVITENLGGTPHRKKKIIVKCVHCGTECEKTLGNFQRSAGQCPNIKCHFPRREPGRDKPASEREYASWESLKRAYKRMNKNMSCAICGLKTWNGYKFPFEMDHIIPLSQEGRNVISNVQPLCGNCHKIKSALEHPGWNIEKVDE